MNLFKKSVKQLFPNIDAVIVPSFSVGGKTYYQFADINAMPYQRGLMAVAVYNELEMRCTRDYLEQHVEAIDNILSKSEIDIYAIKTLNNQMKARLSLKTDTELMYKLASVAFWDENESPVSYDPEYNKKKIAHWKKNIGVADFFLSKPLMDLMPFLNNIDVDLDIYSELTAQLDQIHLEKIHLLNSKS